MKKRYSSFNRHGHMIAMSVPEKPHVHQCDFCDRYFECELDDCGDAATCEDCFFGKPSQMEAIETDEDDQTPCPLCGMSMAEHSWQSLDCPTEGQS